MQIIHAHKWSAEPIQHFQCGTHTHTHTHTHTQTHIQSIEWACNTERFLFLILSNKNSHSHMQNHRIERANNWAFFFFVPLIHCAHAHTHTHTHTHQSPTAIFVDENVKKNVWNLLPVRFIVYSYLFAGSIWLFWVIEMWCFLIEIND